MKRSSKHGRNAYSPSLHLVQMLHLDQRLISMVTGMTTPGGYLLSDVQSYYSFLICSELHKSVTMVESMART